MRAMVGAIVISNSKSVITFKKNFTALLSDNKATKYGRIRTLTSRNGNSFKMEMKTLKLYKIG
jgi:hypothetical protein